MDEDMGALTKKIGPLPGWAWAVLVAGAVWAVYEWQKRKAAAAPVATAPAGADTVFPAAYGNAPGTGTSTGITQAGAQGTSTPTDASWSKMVADALTTSGANPTDVSNALANYTTGQALDPTQQGIINTAIRQYGTPPEGVLPVNNITNDYTGHTYTVQPGDTMYSIIQKFYGNQDPTNIGEQGMVLAAGNNINWDPKTGSHPVTPGQQIKLYADAQDRAHGQPDSFHWTGN